MVKAKATHGTTYISGYKNVLCSCNEIKLKPALTFLKEFLVLFCFAFEEFTHLFLSISFGISLTIDCSQNHSVISNTFDVLLFHILLAKKKQQTHWCIPSRQTVACAKAGNEPLVRLP